MANINEKKLAAFQAALLDNPAISEDDALEILGINANVEVYKEEIAKRAAQASVKPAAAVATVKQGTPEAKQVAKKFIFRNPDGTTRNLQLVKETPSAFIVEEIPPEPEDRVTVIIRGTAVEIDLAALRKLPGNAEVHGLPAAKLILLGEAAK